jgi:hypothetical protein
LKAVEELAIGGSPEAVIADLVEALGQDVLQEAADELVGRQCHGPALVVPGVGIAEGDLSVVAGEDAVVGDGDSVDVSSEIPQYAVDAADAGLAVDDPRAFPDRGGEGCVRQGLGDVMKEEAPEELGEGPDGDEIVPSGRAPVAVR